MSQAPPVNRFALFLRTLLAVALLTALLPSPAPETWQLRYPNSAHADVPARPAAQTRNDNRQIAGTWELVCTGRVDGLVQLGGATPSWKFNLSEVYIAAQGQKSKLHYRLSPPPEGDDRRIIHMSTADHEYIGTYALSGELLTIQLTRPIPIPGVRADGILFVLRRSSHL